MTDDLLCESAPGSQVPAWEVVQWDDTPSQTISWDVPASRSGLSGGDPKPLTLDLENGDATRAATLEGHLEELGVLKISPRPGPH